MTTYTTSTYTQRARTGRHTRQERRWAFWLLMAAAAVLACASLAAGIILISRTGVDVITIAPEIALVALGSMLYTVLLILIGLHQDVR